MQLRQHARVTTMATALLIGLAACGNEEVGGGASDGGGGGETDGARVELTGFAFSPAELTVTSGTEVTFVNSDGTAHTVTEGSDGTAADGARFDEEIADGAEVTVTFDEAGTYQVTCTLHPSMNMTVTVEG
jgi:plastocyanin